MPSLPTPPPNPTPQQAAAAIAAVATALVEAPLELFRHNAQAGTCAAGGNFMREMWRVGRRRARGAFVVLYALLRHCRF